MVDENRVEIIATLTCPHCEAAYELEMPTEYCQILLICPKCGEKITPKEGDCCVFCSYADKKCPPKQAEESNTH
jgi:Zn ribbon nucleic-acid-binding protein